MKDLLESVREELVDLLTGPEKPVPEPVLRDATPGREAPIEVMRVESAAATLGTTMALLADCRRSGMPPRDFKVYSYALMTNWRILLHDVDIDAQAVLTRMEELVGEASRAAKLASMPTGGSES